MPHIALVTEISAPPMICFDVSRDVSVHLASSPTERVVAGVRSGRMQLGDQVTWRSRQFGVTWTMTSKIVEYHPPDRFVDEMQRGPFARWRHEHRFEGVASATRMVDEVDYASPLGPLGRIVDTLVVKRHMTRLLRRRNAHVRLAAEVAASLAGNASSPPST